jgi:hypothetical protein
MAEARLYRVPLTDRLSGPSAVWEAAEWEGVLALSIDSLMGETPAYTPMAQARLQAGPEALYVIFRVQDRHVRAVVKEYQGPVWTDSCVELFFTPGGSVSQGYFNIEVSCGGAVLFQHQQARDTERVPVSAADGQALRVAHSLPAIVDPEMPGPVTWTIEYAVPYAIIEKYAPVQRPASGVLWRANLYKCGDGTSNPHWLTWSPIVWSRPDFHRKEQFGSLVFG